MVHHARLTTAANLMSWLRGRGISLSRVQQLHPSIDRAVLGARRRVYTERFFRTGPRKQGTGRTYVLFNHCYDLDIDALCAADRPDTLWVLDPFQFFMDLSHFFPPEQRDLNCVYGSGAMRESIARFKTA